MGNARTADARLSRLLYVLPAAMRQEGADLEALASELDATVDRILEDIDQLTSRVFYQPGGWPDDVQIFVEAGRVQVRHAAGFERPARLNRDETLCLALALRGGASAAHLGDEEARRALLARAEAHLALVDAAADGTAEGSGSKVGSGAGRADADGDTAGRTSLSAPERHIDVEGIRETMLTAAKERRPCAISYVKAAATDGTLRVIHPYAVAYAEGDWYAVGHCAIEEAPRVFRLDRVLACDIADGSFDVPEDFRLEDFVSGGRVFHTHPGQSLHDVRVRYSPRIARWIRERGQWEADRIEDADDGGVYVRHAVADPNWAVGHTLMYGADAEIVEPEELRELVCDVLGRVGAVSGTAGGDDAPLSSDSAPEGR